MLALRGKSWDFTLRSGGAILLVSVFSYVHPARPHLNSLDPSYGALSGNILCGVGVLILFRHNSSLDGFNIVALLVQERFGLRAGYILMCLDAVVVLASLAVVSPLNVLISAFGTIFLNLILALNHRPDRYLSS
jgi:uncharacterized membrane-anchored protein YitT (DUF2179 family)